MNPALETACRWFGATSCESATAGQYVEMAIAVAVLAIVVVWAAARLRPG